MAKSKLDKWLTKKGKQQLYDLAYNSVTDKELYEALGINHQSFYNYMRDSVEFLETIKRAKADRDDELRKKVLESFTKNKLLGGYKRTETKTSVTTYASGEQSTVEETKVIDEGPDTTAQIFYLKTQCGWNDRQFVTITNGDDIDPFSKSVMSSFASSNKDTGEVGDDNGLLPETDGDL